MTKQQLDDSKELASRDRIVPLAAIDQPLADKLHGIIKAQNEAIIASRKAIAHVLSRISDDALLHAHMGVATQSFDLLTEAASLLFAETKTQVCETFLPCSSAIHSETVIRCKGEFTPSPAFIDMSRRQLALPPPRPIKAISLHQPWADAIARGKKSWETRSWPIKYRGVLAIHATTNWKEGIGLSEHLVADIYDSDDWNQIYSEQASGAVVALVNVVDCWPAMQARAFLQVGAKRAPSKELRQAYSLELELGNYSPGRWAWQLQLLHPVSGFGRVRGYQRLFNLPLPLSMDLQEACAAQAGTSI